jgi:hypothetical protein
LSPSEPSPARRRSRRNVDGFSAVPSTYHMVSRHIVSSAILVDNLSQVSF